MLTEIFLLKSSMEKLLIKSFCFFLIMPEGFVDTLKGVQKKKKRFDKEENYDHFYHVSCMFIALSMFLKLWTVVSAVLFITFIESLQRK